MNTALGGGGSVYTTGPGALFINPANLYIQEREYRLQAILMSGGLSTASPLRQTGYAAQLERYLERNYWFQPGSETPFSDPEQLLARNYPSERPWSEHHQQADMLWFGMHWQGSDRSYAVAMRSRFGSRYLVGRGYYDLDFLENNGRQERDRTHIHQMQSLHELSFGYAESFTFFNSLMPQLSQLIIGVAPKIVVSGAYLDSRLESSVQSVSNQSPFTEQRSFRHYSTGSYSDITSRQIHFSEVSNPIHPLQKYDSLVQPTGYGAGLDFGLTYLITLGDDLSVIRYDQETTRKSLRVSLAITDVGFINYTKRPLYLRTEPLEVDHEEEPSLSDWIYEGQPGEHALFLHDQAGDPYSSIDEKKDENFKVLLPTAVHAGALFQINRVKMMGDFSLGFSDNAFNTTRFITYLGIEVRPLSFLPLRAGTRLAHRLPHYYSFGAGLETRYFDLDAGIQLRTRSIGPTQELAAFSAMALRVYIR
ncbi:MAG: DUF5723 family protein [Balneolaceae bacterium]